MMMPEPKSITLDQAEFQRLVHLSADTPLDAMDDEGDALVCELIGRFLAVNPWLAHFASDVTQITLVARDEKPPRVDVTVVRGGMKFEWTTGKGGAIPGSRRLARRIYRQWAREREQGDGD
jgi:hypothetical protein